MSNYEPSLFKDGRLTERERIYNKARNLKRFGVFSWGLEQDEEGEYVLLRDVIKIIGTKND